MPQSIVIVEIKKEDADIPGLTTGVGIEVDGVGRIYVDTDTITTRQQLINTLLAAAAAFRVQNYNLPNVDDLNGADISGLGT